MSAEAQSDKHYPLNERASNVIESLLCILPKSMLGDAERLLAAAVIVELRTTPSHALPIGEQGRIPELEPTRRNAEYWRTSAHEQGNIDEKLLAMEQAVNAWKNAAYAAWDKINAAPALSTTPQKRLAAWVDGVCKTCGQYTHSCKCEHPNADFMKRLFAAPQEGAGSSAGPATNGEPAAAASWLDTIPTAADGVTCHIRDVRRAFALSATLERLPLVNAMDDALYNAFATGRPDRPLSEAWTKLRAVLGVPTATQQLNNVADALGMTSEELKDSLRRTDGGTDS